MTVKLENVGASQGAEELPALKTEKHGIKHRLHEACDKIDNSRPAKFIGKHKYELYALGNTVGAALGDLPANLLVFAKNFSYYQSPRSGAFGFSMYDWYQAAFCAARVAPIVFCYLKTKDPVKTARMAEVFKVTDRLEDPLFYGLQGLNMLSPRTYAPHTYEFNTGNRNSLEYISSGLAEGVAFTALAETGMRFGKKIKSEFQRV
jgi:hypothetical protein